MGRNSTRIGGRRHADPFGSSREMNAGNSEPQSVIPACLMSFDAD